MGRGSRRMRTQDIVIGETYRHRDHPDYAYAKALKIIRPLPKHKQKYAYDLTDAEKNVKHVCVKCEYTLYKHDAFGMIKYFRPCDLVKEDFK
jgi:hypothetical protein